MTFRRPNSVFVPLGISHLGTPRLFRFIVRNLLAKGTRTVRQATIISSNPNCPVVNRGYKSDS